MTAHDYLNFIVDEIHSTVAATVDSDGLPVTCVIDMMYADENGLYFLTAKRDSFTFGGAEITESGYFVTDDCIRCGSCLSDCPQSCIELKEKALIRQENCLHCGNCAEVCPVGAVIRR